MSRRPRRLLLALAALVFTSALVLRLRYGGGAPFPFELPPPVLPESALEVAQQWPEPIGNIAFDADGRLYFTVHPEARSPGPRLYRQENGGVLPFPSADLQQQYFETPLGIRVDTAGQLWVIDHGQHGTGTPRLTAWSVERGELRHETRFGRDLAPLGSFLQDIELDGEGNLLIADAGILSQRPALIVYAPASRRGKRLLQGDPSVAAQDWLIRSAGRDLTYFGLVTVKAGVDGIAHCGDPGWLYFGAMNHQDLFRVQWLDLLTAAPEVPALAKAVQWMSEKPLSDGLYCDRAGSVYITDVEHGAVLRLGPEGELETVLRSPRIRWADDLAQGPDGALYLADSALPDLILQSRQEIEASGPYFIYRFRIDAKPAPESRSGVSP